MSDKKQDNSAKTSQEEVYWEEMHGGYWKTVSLMPEMMASEPFSFPIKCLLKGEATKGTNAGTAVVRPVRLDSLFCYERINSLLADFTIGERIDFCHNYLSYLEQSDKIKALIEEKEREQAELVAQKEKEIQELKRSAALPKKGKTKRGAK